MLVKTDIEGYLKDEKTGAIVNNNFHELDMILIQRKQHLENVELKTKVSQLEDDIRTIKEMLLSGK